MKFYAVKILCEEKRFFGFTLDYLLVSYNFWKWKKKEKEKIDGGSLAKLVNRKINLLGNGIME